MKQFFSSFYAKISGIFLVLILVLGGFQVYITYHSSMQLFMEADQQLNLNLAENMAGELGPMVSDTLDIPEIKESIHYMMVMNPKVEIYLLNSQGHILGFFAEPDKKVEISDVDTSPIEHFLETEDKTLTLGQDPRQPSRQKPFSAARITVNDEPGYLYIILGGERYETALSMVRNSYILQTSIYSLLGAVMLTGITGLIVFAFVTRRLRRMTRTVRAFAQGDTRKRIEASSSDELGTLARFFNSMADTIVSNMKELKKTDKMRRELVANISHDLRNPLASIQGYLETILLKGDNIDPGKREEYLEIILKNTTQLSNLVQDLFELSKLEAKEVKLEFEPFSISELAYDIINKLKPEANQNDVTLGTDVGRNNLVVEADIGKIERAITNLIRNALKFTPSGGSVRLKAENNGSKIRLSVEDTGCGIDPEDLPYIFNRFYVGSGDKSRSDDSTGLGLSIAQKIIELHDSRIYVESQHGEGAVFYFDLPAAGHNNTRKSTV